MLFRLHFAVIDIHDVANLLECVKGYTDRQQQVGNGYLKRYTQLREQTPQAGAGKVKIFEAEQDPQQHGDARPEEYFFCPWIFRPADAQSGSVGNSG